MLLDTGLVLGGLVLLPLLRRGWVLSRREGAVLLGGHIAYIASLVICPG